MLYLSVLFELGWASEFNLISYDRFGKVHKSDSVTVLKGSVIVNGAQLTGEEAMIKSKYLSHLIKATKKESDLNCKAGYFLYKLKTKELNRDEKGCLNSKRYQNLSDWFDALKKDIVFKN